MMNYSVVIKRKSHITREILDIRQGNNKWVIKKIHWWYSRQQTNQSSTHRRI